MEVKKIIEILENEMNKTSGGWVEIYEEKEFFKNIITLLKEEEGKPREKIYKIRPKGADEYTTTTYGIPQGKDERGNWKPWKTRKLKIGDKYDIVTDEPGQEIYITARFVGWKKDVITRDDGRIIPENISYLALFEAVGYIEVDTDYSLSITKSEKEGGKE